MINRKRIGSLLLMLLVLFGSFMKIPAYAASQDSYPNIKVTGIKLNKKAMKAGKKLTVQLNFRTDIELNKVEIKYTGNSYYPYTAKLKAVNKQKTKWRGTLSIKKNAKKGAFGLARITITGKDHKGKKIKCEIRNNRWSTESFGRVYTIDQNLSAGNIKIIS